MGPTRDFGVAQALSLYDFHRAVRDGLDLCSLARLPVYERGTADDGSYRPLISIKLTHLHRGTNEHLGVKSKQELVQEGEQQRV